VLSVFSHCCLALEYVANTDKLHFSTFEWRGRKMMNLTLINLFLVRLAVFVGEISQRVHAGCFGRHE
jgi:hypothetical protein